LALSQNEWRNTRIQVPFVAVAGLPFKQRRRRRRFAVGENHALRRRLNVGRGGGATCRYRRARERRPTMNSERARLGFNRPPYPCCVATA